LGANLQHIFEECKKSMDKKCEELLDDSVINTRYPNKQKLIIKYLHFFSTLINTRVENFIKTFVEKCGKVWRTIE
jgi:hypothetical protein